jgi:hypothetical protein
VLRRQSGRGVEDVSAELLIEVVRLGTPADLYAAARLGTQVADLLADRWQQRQGELAQIRDDLLRIVEALRKVTSGHSPRGGRRGRA